MVEVGEPKTESYKTEKISFESELEDINTSLDTSDMKENCHKQVEEVHEYTQHPVTVSSSSKVQCDILSQTHINLEGISDSRVRQNCFCENDILVNNTRMINI